jgi:hypothetical protein
VKVSKENTTQIDGTGQQRDEEEDATKKPECKVETDIKLPYL